MLAPEIVPIHAASLLNAQPMGFYAPAQIVRDARDHGVEVRPVCINASRWDCTLEPIDDDTFAVRLGFRQVRGLSNKDGAEIVAARADQPFESVDDLWRRADVPVASLVQLAEADAMNEFLGLARREGPQTAGHLHAGPSHRQHQDEDAGFQVNRASSFRSAST
jgi:error-prone DNA polymerase